MLEPQESSSQTNSRSIYDALIAGTTRHNKLKSHARKIEENEFNRIKEYKNDDEIIIFG